MKKTRTYANTLCLLIMLTLLAAPVLGCSKESTAPRTEQDTPTGTYLVVDTGQSQCYDDVFAITCPDEGDPFSGQDAQYMGNAPSFMLGQDELTVYDSNSGLTWQQSPDTDGDDILDSDDKLTWTEFQSRAAILNAQVFGGYDDWREPTIKELYSLIDFSGVDPSGYSGDPSTLTPFIDTDYFEFVYGDEDAGERIIDAQYWSDTQYVGTVFNNEIAIFGVNFADGRIKGYPRDSGPGGTMTQFARYVRGGTNYGTNDYVDNGDGTITDLASGLMWMQDDSGAGMVWEDALSHAENLSYADHDDWRLPNAKELQSIVDYTRSPTTTGSAAIDPLFSCSTIIDEAGNTNYAFYWASTTHAGWMTGGEYGAYVAFGQALGYMGPPGMESWMDVHGAGAQRSDPKTGDPGDWPEGHGPQGDAIRIFNHVRCVRDAVVTTGAADFDNDAAGELALSASPNPANEATTIRFDLSAQAELRLDVFDVAGRLVKTLIDRSGSEGRHSVRWDGTADNGGSVPAGVYLARLSTGSESASTKLIMLSSLR